MSHLYIGVEVVTMTGAMKNTLVEHLRSLGPKGDDRPSRINHWRIRPDGNAAIFEAEFDAETITAKALSDMLAKWYNVAPATLSTSMAQTPYGPYATVKTGATTRLRIIAFGGVDADWGTSRAAVMEYLAANRDAWEPKEA
jgi:hypothetical protein